MRFLLVFAAVAASCLAPPVRADETKKVEKTEKTYQVPYRLTKTAHVLIRVKINGKGPFNFILDTGAPALFVTTNVCDKLGLKADDKGMGTFDRFELEGGVVLEKARGRVENPFQLEGMNSLGLAGTEIHGMIGYTVIARYRVEFDFTKDKMTWTALDFEPPAPIALGDKGTAEMDTMAGLVKFAAALLGNRPKAAIVVRGFFGMDLAQDEDGVVVKAVVEQGPAEAGGLKAGDRIARFQDVEIKKLTDALSAAGKVATGEDATMAIVRDGKLRGLVIKTKEGL